MLNVWINASSIRKTYFCVIHTYFPLMCKWYLKKYVYWWEIEYAIVYRLTLNQIQRRRLLVYACTYAISWCLLLWLKSNVVLICTYGRLRLLIFLLLILCFHYAENLDQQDLRLRWGRHQQELWVIIELVSFNWSLLSN